MSISVFKFQTRDVWDCIPIRRYTILTRLFWLQADNTVPLVTGRQYRVTGYGETIPCHLLQRDLTVIYYTEMILSLVTGKQYRVTCYRQTIPCHLLQAYNTVSLVTGRQYRVTCYREQIPCHLLQRNNTVSLVTAKQYRVTCYRETYRVTCYRETIPCHLLQGTVVSLFLQGNSCYVTLVTGT